MSSIMSRLARELAGLGGDIKVALEEIRVPAGLVDRDGVIRWQNQAATELFGDNTGVPFPSVVAPGESERVQARVAAIFRAGERRAARDQQRATSERRQRRRHLRPEYGSPRRRPGPVRGGGDTPHRAPT